MEVLGGGPRKAKVPPVGSYDTGKEPELGSLRWRPSHVPFSSGAGRSVGASPSRGLVGGKLSRRKVPDPAPTQYLGHEPMLDPGTLPAAAPFLTATRRFDDPMGLAPGGPVNNARAASPVGGRRANHAHAPDYGHRPITAQADRGTPGPGHYNLRDADVYAGLSGGGGGVSGHAGSGAAGHAYGRAATSAGVASAGGTAGSGGGGGARTGPLSRGGFSFSKSERPTTGHMRGDGSLPALTTAMSLAMARRTAPSIPSAMDHGYDEDGSGTLVPQLLAAAGMQAPYAVGPGAYEPSAADPLLSTLTKRTSHVSYARSTTGRAGLFDGRSASGVVVGPADYLPQRPDEVPGPSSRLQSAAFASRSRRGIEMVMGRPGTSSNLGPGSFFNGTGAGGGSGGGGRGGAASRIGLGGGAPSTRPAAEYQQFGTTAPRFDTDAGAVAAALLQAAASRSGRHRAASAPAGGRAGRAAGAQAAAVGSYDIRDSSTDAIAARARQEAARLAALGTRRQASAGLLQQRLQLRQAEGGAVAAAAVGIAGSAATGAAAGGSSTAGGALPVPTFGSTAGRFAGPGRISAAAGAGAGVPPVGSYELAGRIGLQRSASAQAVGASRLAVRRGSVSGAGGDAGAPAVAQQGPRPSSRSRAAGKPGGRRGSAAPLGVGDTSAARLQRPRSQGSLTRGRRGSRAGSVGSDGFGDAAAGAGGGWGVPGPGSYALDVVPGPSSAAALQRACPVFASRVARTHAAPIAAGAEGAAEAAAGGYAAASGGGGGGGGASARGGTGARVPRSPARGPGSGIAAHASVDASIVDYTVLADGSRALEGPLGGREPFLSYDTRGNLGKPTFSVSAQRGRFDALTATVRRGGPGSASPLKASPDAHDTPGPGAYNLAPLLPPVLGDPASRMLSRGSVAGTVTASLGPGIPPSRGSLSHDYAAQDGQRHGGGISRGASGTPSGGVSGGAAGGYYTAGGGGGGLYRAAAGRPLSQGSTSFGGSVRFLASAGGSVRRGSIGASPGPHQQGAGAASPSAVGSHGAGNGGGGEPLGPGSYKPEAADGFRAKRTFNVRLAANEIRRVVR
jgi:hypothetical protein